MSSWFQVMLPRTKRAKHGRAGQGIIITGDKEIDVMLAELSDKVRMRMQRDELKKAAKQIVLPEAQNRVGEDTGRLQAGLKAKALKRSRQRFGYEVTTSEGLWAGLDYYGGFLEFGTKTKKGAERMPAYPFLRPAGYGNEARIRRMVLGGLRKTLAKAARGQQA